METAAAAAAARKSATSSGLTVLSNRLTNKLSASRSQNLVFSPLSIHAALSLVAAGAQGRTLSELLELLGASTREGLATDVRGLLDRAVPADAPQEPAAGGGPRVAFSSGLWHDATRPLKPAYRDVATASFRAVARAVDFLTKVTTHYSLVMIGLDFFCTSKTCIYIIV